MIDLTTALVRLALATLFGSLLGIEREWRAKHAGIKTNSLVALGAAGFAMMSDTFGANNHNPAQIAAAVVGGIGFIGAGVILHRGATVQGLTTAATMWANASMGVAAGLGHLSVAAILAASILIVQFIGRQIEARVRRIKNRDAPGHFELRVDCERDALPHVRELWNADPALAVTRRSLARQGTDVSIRLDIRTASPDVDLTKIEEALVGLAGVKLVEVKHLGEEN